jgi:hypothetical protein
MGLGEGLYKNVLGRGVRQSISQERHSSSVCKSLSSFSSLHSGSKRMRTRQLGTTGCSSGGGGMRLVV